MMSPPRDHALTLCAKAHAVVRNLLLTWMHHDAPNTLEWIFLEISCFQACDKGAAPKQGHPPLNRTHRQELALCGFGGSRGELCCYLAEAKKDAGGCWKAYKLILCTKLNMFLHIFQIF